MRRHPFLFRSIAPRPFRRQPNSQSSGGIQIQHANGRSPHGCQTDDPEAIPRKVFSPRIGSGMKQRRQRIRLGIEPRQVARFFEIAFRASQSEVVQLIAASMLDWDDVLYLEPYQW